MSPSGLVRRDLSSGVWRPDDSSCSSLCGVRFVPADSCSRLDLRVEYRMISLPGFSVDGVMLMGVAGLLIVCVSAVLVEV